MRQHLWKALILLAWIGIQAYLFTEKFIFILHSENLKTARSQLGVSLAISRASALVINFNSSLILLGGCRVTMTKLKSLSIVHKLGLPLDSAIGFHKLVGLSIGLFSIVHTCGHYVNFTKVARLTNQDIPSLLFLHNTGLTGHILLIVLLLIVISAGIKAVRMKKFEVFYLIHKLFIVYIVTLAIHGCFCFVKTDDKNNPCIKAQSWIWILPGLTLYILEFMYVAVRSRLFGYVSKVILHQSQVFEFQIRKPSFRFTPGQYIYLNVPSVSWYQWHPFTITSAPEDDFVAIHIRVVGNWTGKVAESFGIRRSSEGRLQSCIDVPRIMPKIYIDGPYGAPCQDYSKYEVIVCIGAGIGQTPFSSVLRSIWYSVVHPTDELHIKKLIYVGICRNIQSFEWFHDVLKALESQDTGNLLEIMYFLTGQLEPRQICSLLHLKDSFPGRDQITGLHTPTNFGRPNFDRIIKNIAERYQLCRIGVFYCGPSSLARKLNKYCRRYSSGETKIVFHTEHFDQ